MPTADTDPSPGWREFLPAEADLIEANIHLLWRRVRGLRRVRRPRLLAVLLVGGAAAIAWNAVTEGPSGLVTLGVELLVIALVLPWVFVRWIIPRQVRRMMRDDPRFAAPWRVRIAPEGLHVHTGHGESRYLWSAFTERHVGRQAVVLPTSSRGFVFLPHRALAPDDLATLEGYLRAAGVMLD